MENKRIWLWIAVVAAVIVVALAVYFMQTQPSPVLEQNNNQNAGTNENGSNENQNETKTFTVTARNFSFTPAEIRVNQGDRVKIILNNEEGFHDFVVDEFNTRTEQVMAPATREVEFIANQTGTFEFYCSVGTHRQQGMVGRLIVEAQ